MESRFKDMTFSKKLIIIAGICGAIMTIVSFLTFLYTKYSDHKSHTLKTLQKEINIIVQDEVKALNIEILSLKKEVEVLHTQLSEGSRYFAIGLRGDGTGNKWYRDEFGHIHRAFYSEAYGLHYYLNTRGEFIYVY
jgi:hypothetical protein